MRRRWLLVLSLAGCFRPEPQAGARCGAGGACPSGLTCRDDRCVDDSTPLDDAAIADARPDTRSPSDAMPDAISAVGCADGAREAFVDDSAFPTVAGCAAAWNDAVSLRAAATGQLCGDDLQLCAVPADACAAGWHVCGTNGLASELTSRLSQAQCAGEVGRFVGALSHCSAYDGLTCTYDTPLGCAASGPCSEPVCCGDGCRTNLGCPDGAWPMGTAIAGSQTNGCSAMLATDVTGVLCCR